MLSAIPFPVIASHDIRQGQSALIKTGTPGEITGVSGAAPSYYTVMFWPSGPDQAAVTLSYLTRTDIKDA